MADFVPGGDQKAIHRIAKEFYGDLKTMFARHHWPWSGNRAMAEVATFIITDYGSIKDFADMHDVEENIIENQLYGSLENNIRAKNTWLMEYEVGLKKNWEPKHWGVNGFSSKQEADAFLEQARNGALFVCYDTESPNHRILGIYQHDTTTFVDFQDHISKEAKHSIPKTDEADWNHVFRAVRCWTAPATSELNAKELFPEAFQRLKDLDAAKIENEEGLDKLCDTQWIDTDFFGGHISDDPFQKNPSVYIKAAYGFHPPSWGCIGWNEPGRARTLIQKTTDPFIMANWVTYTSGDRFSGKLAGFYEITHEEGLRQNFTAPYHAENFDEKYWKYSLRASRAWEILPEYQPDIKTFYPEMYTANQERSTGRWGAELPPQLIEKLKTLPRREVEVYGRPNSIDSSIVFPDKKTKKGFVQGGAGRKRGYEVSEPKDTEKELYILKLTGDVSIFLGRNVKDKQIYKVGLSVSPETRQNSLNASLPNGTYLWQIYRTTRQDRDVPYSSFKVAETGEMAMKRYLGVSPGDYKNHLGGEFYLASKSEIEEAWTLGRKTSLEAESKADG